VTQGQATAYRQLEILLTAVGPDALQAAFDEVINQSKNS
jgi:hypothetical protein